jgi:hypothetical protein
MPLVPDGCRCAVALGFDCGNAADPGLSAALQVASLAAGEGLRAQFFVPGVALEDSAEAAAELARLGHDVDGFTYDGAPLLGTEPEALREQITSTQALLGQVVPGPCVGLRAPDMARNGLQKHEDIQQLILDCGLSWVGSDYSARNPEAGSVGFADKNAAMLTKHQQPRWYASGLLEIPSPGFSDKAFLVEQGRSLEEWTAHLCQCLDFASDMGGLLFAADLHPALLLAHDPGLSCLRALIQHARDRRHGAVRFCSYREVWQWAVEARRAG